MPVSAEADTIVLEGSHRVVLDIINPGGVKFIPDYSNAGFSQRVLERKPYSARVEITIDLEPLHPDEPFPISARRLPEKARPFLESEYSIQSDHTEVRTLARSLAAGADTELRVFENISYWVADNIDYVIDTPQDALSVLRNRKGSCAGQTRLIAALLRSLGIPARYARGYLPPGGRWGFEKEYWGVKIMSGGYHAWIEVYFPGSGWIFSDILHSLFFVDPYHLLFHISGTNLNPDYEQMTGEDGGIEVEQGTSFTVFHEDDRSAVKDAVSTPERRLLSRRTREQQGCAVYGRAFDSSGEAVREGQFIFWKENRGEVHALNKSGSFGLAGFPPGAYEFGIRAEGYAEAKERVTFDGPGARRLDFRLKPGGSIHGRVTDEDGRPVAGARVYLWHGAGGLIYPADENGSYSIIGCPTGRFRLSVEGEGYKAVGAEVEVRPGQKIEKDFILPR